MNNSRNTDLPNPEAELKKHIPLLIRWGVACLMVIGALIALAAQGEGEMNFLSLAVFVAMWLGCLFKAGQSAFIVVAALLDKQSESEPD